MGVTRITRLSDDEKARFNEWADKWIEIGLRTGPADREKFENAVRDCYRFAGIPFPEVVVWVPSPLVLAIAAPVAALSIELLEAEQRAALRGGGAVREAVDGAVREAVAGAVAEAVREAVDGAVRGAVAGAVAEAVDGAVREAVEGAVREAVEGAVREAVDGAVDEAVEGAVAGAVREAVAGAVRGAVAGAVAGAVEGAVIGKAVANVIRSSWNRYLGGQLWVGGWYWGGAWTSFFRDVCKLELNGDLWERALAYEATMESACWWWPHREFVMVCERPTVIHRELANSDVERGWGSHRLHCDDGPAVAWPDGWGVWAIHGVRVTKQIVEAPETLTPAQILGEPNAEVRRVMMERFGFDRLLDAAEAKLVDADLDQQGRARELWRLELADDEPLVMVRVVNSTPEPDESYKHYTLRVPPNLNRACDAVAWTFDLPASEYVLAAES